MFFSGHFPLFVFSLSILLKRHLLNRVYEGIFFQVLHYCKLARRVRQLIYAIRYIYFLVKKNEAFLWNSFKKNR